MDTSMSETHDACAVCGKVEEEGNKLNKCARCNARSYCGIFSSVLILPIIVIKK